VKQFEVGEMQPPEKQTRETIEGTIMSSNTTAHEESIFISYFMEINEQVHDAMSGGQPEPERALESLKKLEEFSLKIEKAIKVKDLNDQKAAMF